MRKLILAISMVIFLFGLQYLCIAYRKQKLFMKLSSLPNIKTVELTDNDEIFELTYDAVIILKNGDKVILDSVRTNLEAEETILMKIDTTAFICYRQVDGYKYNSYLGLPLHFIQLYLGTDISSISLFFENYDIIKKSLKNLNSVDFSADILSKRGKIGWGIDEKGREYYLGIFSRQPIEIPPTIWDDF